MEEDVKRKHIFLCCLYYPCSYFQEFKHILSWPCTAGRDQRKQGGMEQSQTGGKRGIEEEDERRAAFPLSHSD